MGIGCFGIIGRNREHIYVRYPQVWIILWITKDCLLFRQRKENDAGMAN